MERSEWRQYLRAANVGDVAAQVLVGCTYAQGAADVNGESVARRNRLAASRWLKVAAKSGDPWAQLALSDFLSEPGSAECDFPMAVAWAKKALRQGLPQAAHNLACVYRDMRKPALAFRYFKLAANMGEGDDWLDCALCYLTAYGVAQNFELAADSLGRVLSADSNRVTPFSRESALYWSAVMNLLGLTSAKRSVAQARAQLELANADDDLEQANELLNLIGRTAQAAQKKKPARGAGRAGGTS